MKREIKFRAWIPSYEQMLVLENTGVQKYDCENGFSLGFTADGYSEIWAHENYGIVEDAVIMQFTGLHDKNGKEIYQGDIIRDCLTMQVYTVKFGFCKKYAFNGWYVETVDGYQAQINSDSDSDRNSMIEVIGNIYENSELIQ